MPESPAYVSGDPARLEQVVVDLLTNAARYTEPGGRIEIAARQDSGEVVVTVRDNGIGMRPELIPSVFDLFPEAECARDRRQGGLESGLSDVKRIVELHGGTVKAHSEGEWRGSTFEVRLPAVARPDEAPPEEPNVTGTRAGRIEILIVEDNPDAAESLKMLLETLGHHTTAVTDGAAAVELMTQAPADVMLIDIGLPDIDGYEVARRVRALPTTGKQPIMIALTGYGRQEDRDRAAAAGFDRHLVKPIRLEALQRLLDACANPSTFDSRHHPATRR